MFSDTVIFFNSSQVYFFTFKHYSRLLAWLTIWNTKKKRWTKHAETIKKKLCFELIVQRDRLKRRARRVRTLPQPLKCTSRVPTTSVKITQDWWTIRTTYMVSNPNKYKNNNTPNNNNNNIIMYYYCPDVRRVSSRRIAWTGSRRLKYYKVVAGLYVTGWVATRVDDDDRE